MLLPDEENLPAWLLAELDALREDLGPDPPIDVLRAARSLLSARGRAYLRALAVRAEVTRLALEYLASGELADVDFGDGPASPRAAPTEPPARRG